MWLAHPKIVLGRGSPAQKKQIEGRGATAAPATTGPPWLVAVPVLPPPHEPIDAPPPLPPPAEEPEAEGGEAQPQNTITQ